MNAAYQETLLHQARASDPRANAWVAASAGTGKTHVLTQRVIRLLINKTPPERILCLTFTKAAAAEMAKRLFATLGTWATLPDGELTERIEDITRAPVAQSDLIPVRRLFAQALETPGGLKIQTIHAFCERLLKRFPLEARIPPFFEVLDERSAQDLLNQAKTELLFAAGQDPESALGRALAGLITHVDETGFDELLSEVVNKRRAIAQWIDSHKGLTQALTTLARDLGVREGETEEHFLKAACAEPSFPRGAMARAAQALSQGSKKDKKQAAIITCFLTADDPVTAFNAYARAFLTIDGGPRVDVVTKPTQNNHPDLEGVMRAEQQRILDVEKRRKAIAVFQATQNMLILSEYLLKIFALKKRLMGGLDYDDLILASRDLLTRARAAAWVLYKLDGGIDHILVDEAQDTSPEQWRVIEALAQEFFAGSGAHDAKAPANPRTIFAVGDEKQSIYSFQGADPDMFHEMMIRFSERVRDAGGVWSPVDLTLSFRSTREVLQAVDSIFEPGAVAQSLTASGQIVRHQPRRLGAAGLVELWPVIEAEKPEKTSAWDAPFDQRRESHPKVLLAERIAALIQSWIKNKTLLESQGRPIKGGDILILLRRRSAMMEEMVRALKRRGLPVAGADRIVLTDQLAVMDLMALGAFALLPGDDLTLAAVLKSPLIGFSEDALFSLAYDRKTSLWRALGARSAAEPAGVYAAAHKNLNHILSQADWAPPLEFFQRILSQTWMGGDKTGRRLLLERLGRDAEDPLDEFLSLALGFEKQERPSLQNFLHWMEQGGAVLKREHDLGKDEVRVMTVHGSKGLEGNIVFLPDTCASPDGTLDPKILELPGGGFTYPKTKKNDDGVSRTAREAQAEKRDAEYHRLLYVAATRARDRLYIAGFGGNKSRPEGCWYDLAAAAIKPLAAPVSLPFGETGWRIAGVQDPGQIEDEKDQSAAPAPAQPLPPWVSRPASPEAALSRPLSPSALGRAGERQEAPALSPLSQDDPRRFARGRLIHKLLEILPGLPPPRRAGAAPRVLSRKAPDFTREEQDVMARETDAILSDKEFAPIFGPGSLAEIRIAGTAKNPPLGLAHVSGQIDRLLINDDKILVIDYKTNRPPPRDPNKVSPLYLRQMAVYQTLLAEAYPGRQISCALLWTDGPFMMKLPNPLLEKALSDLETAPSR